MNSSAMVSALRSYLVSAGININRHTESGSLTISSDQSHLIGGRFEIDPMISKLKNEALRSQSEGYAGVWISGDMTWEFGNEKNLEKLLEYEYKLEQLFHEVPSLNGICQYHMDTLPPDCIADALHAHQEVCINESLNKSNPHYVQPEQLSRGRPSITEEQLQNMLRGLGLQSYPLKIRDA